MDCAAITAQGFRTPARILIPKLVASREGWKAKAGQRKGKLRAARIRVRDLEASRERWQERAGAAELQLAELNRQLQQTRQELAAARSDAEQLRDELKKS
jgi:chromosome segregation ATPase